MRKKLRFSKLFIFFLIIIGAFQMLWNLVCWVDLWRCGLGIVVCFDVVWIVCLYFVCVQEVVWNWCLCIAVWVGISATMFPFSTSVCKLSGVTSAGLSHTKSKLSLIKYTVKRSNSNYQKISVNVCRRCNLIQRWFDYFRYIIIRHHRRYLRNVLGSHTLQHAIDVIKLI